MKSYLNGFTVVKRNLSANPLSCHTVQPITTSSLKKGCDYTPKDMDVQLGALNIVACMQSSIYHLAYQTIDLGGQCCSCALHSGLS